MLFIGIELGLQYFVKVKSKMTIKSKTWALF